MLRIWEEGQQAAGGGISEDKLFGWQPVSKAVDSVYV